MTSLIQSSNDFLFHCAALISQLKFRMSARACVCLFVCARDELPVTARSCSLIINYHYVSQKRRFVSEGCDFKRPRGTRTLSRVVFVGARGTIADVDVAARVVVLTTRCLYTCRRRIEFLDSLFRIDTRASILGDSSKQIASNYNVRAGSVALSLSLCKESHGGARVAARTKCMYVRKYIRTYVRH